MVLNLKKEKPLELFSGAFVLTSITKIFSDWNYGFISLCAFVRTLCAFVINPFLTTKELEGMHKGSRRKINAITYTSDLKVKQT